VLALDPIEVAPRRPLRSSAPADEDRLLALYAASSSPMTRDEYRARNSEGDFILQDDRDGELEGAIHVRFGGPVGTLSALSVSQPESDPTLSRRLVAVAEMLCEAHGCVEVEIDAAEEAQELVGELGYRKTESLPRKPLRPHP
jgi:hypothetical protein